MSDSSSSSRHADGKLVVGSMFGRYRIEKKLGEGAMGAVFLAHDTKLSDRPVALKVPKFAGDNRDEELKRFHREAGIAATLTHPNLCPVYDVGELDGVHYIAMGFVEGKPISEILGGKPIAEKQAALLVRKIALAMQAAHEKGVVHRDLKPANVMLDARKEPIVMDFGLAKQKGGVNDAHITQSGVILGTPAYMSPEQVNGEVDRIGPCADVYSLGVILYELLAGVRPFQGPITSVLGQILTKDPPPLRQHRPNADPRLEAIVLKAMSKQLENRYPNMTAFAAALAEYVKQLNAGSSVSISKDDETLKPEEMSLGSAQALVDAARQCLTAYDYAEASRLFETIPPKYRTEETEALWTQASKRAREVDDLQTEIELSVEARKYKSLKPKLERLLKLKPGLAEPKKLLHRLNSYGDKQGKLRFNDAGELLPAGKGDGLFAGMGLKYAAVIGTAVVAFGIGTALIYTYLRKPKPEHATAASDTHGPQSSGTQPSMLDAETSGLPAAFSAPAVAPKSDSADEEHFAAEEAMAEPEAIPADQPPPSVVLTSAAWEWTEPKPLVSTINTDARESSPSMSDNGRILFFLRDGAPMVTMRKSTTVPFPEPRFLKGPLHKIEEREIFAISLTGNGLTMVLGMRPKSPKETGQPRKSSVWITQRDRLGQSFDDPILMPPHVNASPAMRSPWISRDGLTLIISRTGDDSTGLADLYQHSRPSPQDEFGPAVHLRRPASTPMWDVAGSLTPDRLLLFRTTRDPEQGERARPAISAMFTRPTPNDKFNTAYAFPESILKLRPSHITCTRDGKRIYFDALRDGDTKNLDLFMVERVLKGTASARD